MVLVLAPASPAGATVGAIQSVSWNMNGGGNWGNVAALAQTNDVVALQESGTPPNMGAALRAWTFTNGGNTYTIDEYLWQIGSR